MILRTLITLDFDLLITFGGCSLVENPINITNKISRSAKENQRLFAAKFYRARAELLSCFHIFI